MVTADSIVRDYFKPLWQLPCWHVTAEYGTWLSFRFGEPHLSVREGNPEAKARSLQRRAVHVEGEFLLWVEMGAWTILEAGRRVYHSGQTRPSLRRAAARLDSQKIERVDVQAKPLATIFSFDEGSRLRVYPAKDCDPDDPLWHLYGRSRCLTLLANGSLQYGSEKREPRHILVSSVYCAA